MGQRERSGCSTDSKQQNPQNEYGRPPAERRHQPRRQRDEDDAGQTADQRDGGECPCTIARRRPLVDSHVGRFVVDHCLGGPEEDPPCNNHLPRLVRQREGSQAQEAQN
jgi:hypothetical protein